MVSRRRYTGLTIIEVVIFTTILFGLMSILTLFLIKGRHYARQTESYGFSQREATKIIRKASDDLYQGTSKYFNLGANSFYFLSSRPLNNEAPVEFDLNTGGTLWKSWVCYSYSYDPAEQEVTRSMILLTSPTSNLTSAPLPNVTLANFIAAQPSDRQAVGRGVHSFSILPAGISVYTLSVTTRFNGGSAQTTPDGPYAEVTLSGTVRLPKNDT